MSYSGSFCNCLLDFRRRLGGFFFRKYYRQMEPKSTPLTFRRFKYHRTAVRDNHLLCHEQTNTGAVWPLLARIARTIEFSKDTTFLMRRNTYATIFHLQYDFVLFFE